MNDRPRLSNRDLALKVQRAEEEALLKDQKFRRFLFRLMRDCGMFYPTFRRASPHDTSYAEGRRSLGLDVLHQLKHVEPGILGVIEAEGNLLAIAYPDVAPDPLEDEGPDAPPPDVP